MGKGCNKQRSLTKTLERKLKPTKSCRVTGRRRRRTTYRDMDIIRGTPLIQISRVQGFPSKTTQNRTCRNETETQKYAILQITWNNSFPLEKKCHDRTGNRTRNLLIGKQRRPLSLAAARCKMQILVLGVLQPLPLP